MAYIDTEDNAEFDTRAANTAQLSGMEEFKKDDDEEDDIFYECATTSNGLGIDN